MEPIIGVSTAKLNEALAKAQGEIKPAAKSSENPFFKSKFANLEEVILSLQGPAAKNGLSVIFDFKTEFIENNPASYIRYMILHSSGESFQSHWILMFMKDKTAQGFGAACTYYKRQLLKAMFNIPESDDDDGNSISIPDAKNYAPKAPVKNYAPQSAQEARTRN